MAALGRDMHCDEEVSFSGADATCRQTPSIKQGATMMNHDDHAMFIEVKAQLEELRTRQAEAQDASAWAAVQRLQAEIEHAEAQCIEILRRTEPEDIPNL
jgi:hypothetical protein